MSGRLWYPQLDVYDSVRRLSALVGSYSEPPGIERLFIADFYLANAPLLHDTTMRDETRRAFRALQIPRPKKSFLIYPAPPLLFARMEPVQKEALRAMSGKGLILMSGVRRGVVELTEAGEAFTRAAAGRLAAQEKKLVPFLTEAFAGRAEVGSRTLRQRTGLRRPV